MIVAAGFERAAADVAGVAGRSEVAHVRDEEELKAILDAPRDWQAILLGPALPTPVDVARSVRARLPDVPIILLSEPAEAARVQHQLLLAPIRGEPVRCVPLETGAQHVLEQHLRQAYLRRRNRVALRNANEALSAGPRPIARLPAAMEQLIEATPVPLLVATRDGRLVHRNRAARALQPARATTLKESLAGMDVPIAQLLSRTDPVPLRRVSWNSRCYDVLASPLVVPPALDAVLVILDDISDAVRAEEARAREAEIHATILAAQSDMGEGMFLIENERFVYANDALMRMLGVERDKLRSVDPYTFIAESDRARVRSIHARRMTGDRSIPEMYQTTFVRTDGVAFPVEVTARQVGTRGTVVVLVRDITRRVAMLADIEKARAGLAQMDKLATIGSLVSGLAHEIRTPLAAIVNEANLIDRHVQRALAAEDAKAELRGVHERVEALEEAVDRIRRLTRDMRAFMRGETPQKARVQLDPAIDDAVRFFGSTQRGSVRVERRLGSSAYVEADTAQVQQIVINLLQNAAEASASGATVVVETRDEPDAVVVSVVDQGPGIPPEILGRIFEAFVSTKARGSGLGLTIVRRLAEIHGARVEIDTAADKGTRFDVRFPRVA